MLPAALADEIKSRLQAIHRQRLKGIVLYGSEARGEAQPDSDIDILVLLEEPIVLVQDLDKNLAALYPLSQTIGRRISPKPIGVAEYEQYDCPLYRSARQEGIVL